MQAARWIGKLFVAFSMYVAMGAVQAAPENGWWWNSAQSGRGFSMEVQGDTMFLAGYFYESDGRATWLASAGPMQDATSYQGRLSAYGNGQTLTGNYQAPGAATDAGGIGVHFNDDTHATLTWPGGTVALERFRFSNAAAPSMQPETGWWWNSAESGRGIFFEVQGNQMFTAGYMYDAGGHPVWYASAGTMSSPASYQGRLDQYANGQTLTGAYRAPGAPANAGSISAQFSAADKATVTLTDTEGGMAGPMDGAKRGRILTMERYRYGKVAKPTRPNYWKGTYEYTFETGAVGSVDYSKLTVKGSITWIDTAIGSSGTTPLNGSTQYEIMEGNSESTLDESVTTTTGACPGRSTATGHVNEALFKDEGNLNLKPDDTFSGSLFFPVTLPLTFTTPCASGNKLQTFVVFVDLSGKMVYLNMSGDRPDVGLIPGARITSKWNFSAVQ